MLAPQAKGLFNKALNRASPSGRTTLSSVAKRRDLRRKVQVQDAVAAKALRALSVGSGLPTSAAALVRRKQISPRLTAR